MPAPHGWRVGRGIDPACLLGAGLRPAATRHGQGAPGNRARLGLPMDAPPCSGWAGAPARRCLRVSSSAHTPQRPTPAPRGTWSLQRSKNTLTAPLRACVRQGPRAMCACPQLVPYAYWITSSARSSREGGIVIPSPLAVLRLMTSSNCVGSSTGRSAGLVPFKMRST